MCTAYWDLSPRNDFIKHPNMEHKGSDAFFANIVSYKMSIGIRKRMEGRKSVLHNLRGLTPVVA